MTSSHACQITSSGALWGVFSPSASQCPRRTPAGPSRRSSPGGPGPERQPEQSMMGTHGGPTWTGTETHYTVCACTHLPRLQLPGGRVTAALQRPQAALQVAALPLRHGRVVHRLSDTAQGHTQPHARWLALHHGSVPTSERTPTSLARRWAESRLWGAEPASLADRESTS